jgi:hypothetical protein
VKPSLFYKIASVLLTLFAVGHTLGFRQIDPGWKVDSLVASMQTIHFEVQGFSRTYWDFYVGFGLFVSVLLFLAAVIAWQLGSIQAEILARLTILKWGLALCLVAVTVLSWRYFFWAPVIFSSVITFCLILGAWFSKDEFVVRDSGGNAPASESGPYKATPRAD